MPSHSTDGLWVPKGIKVPMVPANTMLLAFVPICVFAQWAVYAARRDARSHTAMALGLVGMIGLAIINAQAFIYARMKLPINGKGRRPSTRCSTPSPARSCCS